MHPEAQQTTGPQDAVIQCERCRGTMRVAPEHVHRVVECPHCRRQLQPWRILGGSVEMSAWLPNEPFSSRGPQPPDGISWRKRWIAGVLGILLGPWGVHRFYLGYTGIGLLQIVVTIVTFGIGGLWGFIEGVLCFVGAMHDVDGMPLRDGDDHLPLRYDANGLPLGACRVR